MSQTDVALMPFKEFMPFPNKYSNIHIKWASFKNQLSKSSGQEGLGLIPLRVKCTPPGVKLIQIGL